MMIKTPLTVVNIEYVILPVTYLTLGMATVQYINRNGGNILSLLSEAGIGAKGQGIAYAFLTLTWPVWAFIAMQATFRNYFENDNE